MRFQPGYILFAVGGVDRQEEIGIWITGLRIRQFVNEQIVHAAAIGIAEDRIMGVKQLHFGHIVGDHAIQKGYCLWTAHLSLAHMVDIEQPRHLAGGVMLRQRAGWILHGHFPTRKWHHTPAICYMPGV